MPSLRIRRRIANLSSRPSKSVDVACYLRYSDSSVRRRVQSLTLSRCGDRLRQPELVRSQGGVRHFEVAQMLSIWS